MQRLNKKLEAFTISEMLVVLVISGIVISLSLVVLTLVQKQIQSMNKNQEKQSELRLLERALWWDFNKYDLTYTKQQLTCVSELDTVTYVFSQDHVLRNNDTLKINAHNVKVYLDGALTNLSTIDAIELDISKTDQERTIFFYKTKDAAHFINNGL